MPPKDFEPAFDEESDEDEASGLDLERVKELLGFAARSPRRHKGLSIGLFCAGVGVTAALVVLLPRAYTTEVKLLAQKNLVVPSIGNPNRSMPFDPDNAQRSIADVVSERANVVALVKDVDLVDRWDAERPPVLRAKDAVFSAIFGKPSEDDKLRALLAVVEQKVVVAADDTSVTITVEWAEPQMAYELASTVQKNFLDAKYDVSVGMISGAIATLEKHVATENDNIGIALADLRAAEAQGGPAPAAAGPDAAGGTPRAAPRYSAAPKRAAAPTPDAELAPLLEEKRAQIKKVKDAHDQRLADLNKQLSDALGTYTPAHPTVRAIKAQLEDASHDPPELARLEDDERAIVAQIAATGPASPAQGAKADPVPRAPTAPASSAAPAAAPGAASEETTRSGILRGAEDPGVAVARYKLQSATQKYNELQARIDAARIDLDVARSTFKYRFSVVHPAELPKGPRKPSVPKLALGGLLASILLAIAAAVGADLASGKFIESSQVRRRLDLPLLGEIESS
jgi:uncharacterized protein involved in exopolysaccharide biosynthesis